MFSDWDPKGKATPATCGDVGDGKAGTAPVAHPLVAVTRPLLLSFRPLLAAFAAGVFFHAGAARADWDEVTDGLGRALDFAAADGSARLKFSGRLDLASYYVPEPTADLLYTGPEAEVLFSPVLRLFADARLGERFRAQAQLRADRGFDPADQPVDLRLEEAAIRFTPWSERRFTVQAGQFATIFGSWARRHAAWDYPFITAPLAQENLTGLWDGTAVARASTLERWAHVAPVGDAAALVGDEDLRLPIMWGAVYGTGVAVAVGAGRWDFAAEFKNCGLSSRPDVWNDRSAEAWEEPTLAARLGWRPAMPWELGVSLARGSYLAPGAERLVAGSDRGDYHQTTAGLDLAYAWRHFQFWGEALAARFAVPGLGDADTLSYALETKVRVSPRWAVFARWSQQVFLPVELAGGGEARWGRDAWRLEAGPALRLAANAQLKAQVGVLHERPAAESLNPSAAVQLSVRF